MTGFEPRISGIGSDRFANWTTITAQNNAFAQNLFALDV